MNYFKYVFILVLLFAFGGNTSSWARDGGNKHKKDKQEIRQQKSAGNIAYLIDAKKNEITGNIDKAEEMYRILIDKYPEEPTAYFELARILANKKQYSDAVKLAHTACELDPENVWYQLFLAESLQLNGNIKDATGVYEELLKKHPDNFDFYYQLAALYLSTEKYTDAVRMYDKLEEKTGVSEELSIQKEKIYLVLKENAKAQKELENLVNAFPEETKFLSILAEFYLTNGKPDKALEIYKRIAFKDPKNPYIHMSMADYYRKTGDKEKAFEELKLGFANPALDIDSKVNILLSFYTVNQLYNDLKEQAFTLSKILVETHPNEAKAHSVYGDLLLQDKQTEAAREEFLNVIRIDSSRYAAWEELLQLDLQLSKFDHLKDFSRRVIELFPEQPAPYIYAGIVNYQLKNYEQAVKDLNSGIKLVVNNDELLSQFYMYLGDANHAMKNAEESDKSYERSLQLKADNAYVLNNYSYYLSLRNQELEKAEKMAKKAVTIDPENPSFQDTYGWVLFKTGKFEEAKVWVQKAIQGKEAPSGEVLEHYGDILYRLGDMEQAMEYWKKAKAKGQGTDLLDKKIADKKLYE